MLQYKNITKYSKQIECVGLSNYEKYILAVQLLRGNGSLGSPKFP